jgi:hypothetical protein
MQELEESFPTHRPLLPLRGTREEARVSPLLRLERKAFRHFVPSLYCSYLSSLT